MAGKSRTGKGKSSQARKPRRQSAPVVTNAAIAPPQPADAAAAIPSAARARRRAPVITDLAAATAERYPYITGELKLIGILAALIVVLLIVLGVTLS